MGSASAGDVSSSLDAIMSRVTAQYGLDTSSRCEIAARALAGGNLPALVGRDVEWVACELRILRSQLRIALEDQLGAKDLALLDLDDFFARMPSGADGEGHVRGTPDAAALARQHELISAIDEVRGLVKPSEPEMTWRVTCPGRYRGDGWYEYSASTDDPDGRWVPTGRVLKRPEDQKLSTILGQADPPTLRTDLLLWIEMVNAIAAKDSHLAGLIRAVEKLVKVIDSQLPGP
jgi:hypothetical protein